MDCNTYLVDQCSTVNVVGDEDLTPKIGLTALYEIACLLLEHSIVICDRNKLLITEAFRICNVCQVGIASLAEFTDYQRFVKLYLSLVEQTNV